MLCRLIILRQRLIMYKSIRLVIIHLYKCRSWVLNKINSSYIKLKKWCWDPSLHGHKVTLEICGRFVKHSKPTTWVTGYRPDNRFQIFRGEHVVKILPSTWKIIDQIALPSIPSSPLSRKRHAHGIRCHYQGWRMCSLWRERIKKVKGVENWLCVPLWSYSMEG